MKDNIRKNKLIITVAVLLVVIIAFFSIALSGNFSGTLEFKILNNQETGEPLGVLASLFLYVLMLLLFGLVPSSCVFLFAMLVYFFLHRKDPNLFKKGYSPKYEEEFEYAGKLSFCSTYAATFMLILLYAIGLFDYSGFIFL